MVATRKLTKIIIILGVVFLLAGGISALSAYAYGAKSYEQYACASTMPLFFGFVLFGAYGLLFAYKNHQSAKCLLGLLVAVVCYFCIEVFINQMGII